MAVSVALIQTQIERCVDINSDCGSERCVDTDSDCDSERYVDTDSD